MAIQNQSMIRGNSAAFGLEYEGTDQDLDAAYWTIKKDWNDVTPLVQKTIGDGITKVDTSTYIWHLDPEDTANLAPDFYVYDCKIEMNNDAVTILSGTLHLRPDATT